MGSRNLKRTLTDLPPPRFNPWKRSEPISLPWDIHDEKRDHFGRFDEFVQANMGLDCTTKTIALKASPFVVSLASFSGIKRLFMCSGIVVSSIGTGDGFYNTILTSATLLKRSHRKHAIADDLKVDVYLPDGSLCEGEVEGYDFHYNVAAVSIKSGVCLETVKVDDSSEAATFNFSPGMDVIAVGRYCDHPYHIMAAPGVLKLEDSGLDCKELLMSDCEITKNGIGGPIITYDGHVIGMSFYKPYFTPFLPINIALKCLDYFRTCSKVPRLWLGVALADLDTLRLDELEKLNQTLSILMDGVAVREVEPESPASHAGLCTGDIILQLDKRPVRKVLKFKSLLFHKARGPLEVIVKRPGCDEPLTLTLCPQRPRKRNRWLIPKEWTIQVPGK